MKVIITVWCLSVACFAHAQKQIGVAENKTTSLVFALPVVSVDRGSASVLVQKASGAENIVLVKAANKNTETTNLSVITSDGQLHSFIVQYQPEPAELVIRVDDARNKTQSLLQAAARATTNIKVAKSEKGGIHFSIFGSYVNEERMLFKIEVKNQSAVNYDVEQLRIYVKDRKRSKRTARQEMEIMPVLASGEMRVIRAYTSDVWIVGVNKFTIEDSQEIQFELQEKNGGRHLRLKLGNKQLKHTVIINEQ